MQKNIISIATITWARDQQEEDLLRQSLPHLAAPGIKVFITDGGSGSAFLHFLRSFPNFVVSAARVKGVWAQARSSLAAAYQENTAFIFYTEPDKTGFFHTLLPRMIHEVQADEQTGIVLAARSAYGFATFPGFQQMTETAINNCCAAVIDKTFDFTYGPFLLNRQLVPYLEQMREDTGWGWRPYAFNIASRLKLKVDAFEADFVCPAQQQQDNPSERIYRMRQLSQNIQCLVLSTNVVL